MRTFIDVDNYVGLNGLNCALDLKEYWKRFGVDLQIGTQLLEGLDDERNIKLFNIASEKVDFIGCLPSRDKNPEKHLDIIFKKAQELNKYVEAHLDQCNLPTEYETEMFCDYVDKYNYSGKARAIHCISLSCHNQLYQENICKKLKHLDIGVIICPSAAISMTQHSEIISPIHNSIAPIKLMTETGIELGLGIDNIEDIFMPYCEGDLEFELRLLAESARIYEPQILEKIASNNIGFK
jgi:cytosine/creatinine deaminase